MIFKHFFTKIIFSIFFAISLSACGGGSDNGLDDKNLTIKHQNILMIGDSLTDDKYYKNPENYWVKKLTNQLDSDNLNVTIINQAEGGENSKQATQRIPDYLKTDADIVFIFIGTNDVFHLASPEDTNRNIRLIMDTLLAQKSRHFILTNLKFPIGLTTRSQNPEFVSSLELIIPQIQKDYNHVTIVDNYFKNINPPELTIDGFHVIESAQSIIADTMLPIFEKVIIESSK